MERGLRDVITKRLGVDLLYIIESKRDWTNINKRENTVTYSTLYYNTYTIDYNSILYIITEYCRN